MRTDIEQAITTLQERKPGATEKALSLLQDTIFSFSMKVCGHRQDAEDTMQETLMQALRKLSSFTSPKALAVWLYKVARSRCLMSRRKSKFAPKEELSIEVLMPNRQELKRLAGGDPSPERSAMGRESVEQIQKAVLRLPPEYRLVLVLHDMEELSTAEIADVMGVEEGTVRVRLHRARVFARNELAKARGAKAAARREVERRPLVCKKLFAELSDYLDANLDDSMCDELEHHLEGCSPCQAFLASLKRTVEECRRHAPARLNAEKSAQIRASLLAQYQKAVGKLSSTP
ncbi:MAG: sigma-70 family RNA polymerase sigma factor [Acidobacteria bacterium]|nr:sigma-70 family RNA polymerase sigma factor [Acidobacteriota bacterium]